MTIFFVMLVTFSYSQVWDDTRTTDLYKPIFFNVEIGHEFGVGNDSISRTVFDFSVMGNPDEHFSIGAGTGIRYYRLQEMVLLPIFIDIRGYPFTYRKTWIPYVSLKLGHTFNLSDNFDPIGFMVTPSAGMMYENRKNKFYSISINYSIQSVEQPQPPNVNWNGIGLIFGYSF